MGSPITWTTDQLPGRVIVVSFRGRGGCGSDGNHDGERMREAIRDMLADNSATGLVIDLTGFDYRFGDWIGSVPLAALPPLGIGRVCIVATGESAAALQALWSATNLGRLVPIFNGLEEALRYLSEPERA